MLGISFPVKGDWNVQTSGLDDNKAIISIINISLCHFDRAKRVEKSLRPLYQADAYIFVILRAPQVVVCAFRLICVKKGG